MLYAMNRDSFDPREVLKQLRKGKVPPEDALRLLEEGCHAFARLQHEHNSMVLRIRAAIPSD